MNNNGEFNLIIRLPRGWFNRVRMFFAEVFLTTGIWIVGREALGFVDMNTQGEEDNV